MKMQAEQGLIGQVNKEACTRLLSCAGVYITRGRQAMQKSSLLMAVAGLLLSGCAITSSHDVGPNGQPVHFIDAMSASVAYRKAQQLCPSGYSLIGEPRMVSVMDYVMTVECKGPRTQAAGVMTRASQEAAPAAPAPAQIQTAKGPVDFGKYVGAARQTARDQACAEYPEPKLLSAEPGLETFTVACDSGRMLVMRCEFTNCREMR